MAKMIQFEGGDADRRGPKVSSPGCLECEANLIDAVDGTLSQAEQARFDAHIAGCSTCSEMLGEAQRGVAWLEMLKTPRPEPPAALLEKILAQTSGTGLPRQPETEIEWAAPSWWPGYGLPVAPSTPIQIAQPYVAHGNILPFRARMAASAQMLRFNLLQPRLAMTAAMAFFSVALTLNLTGVRLNQLHASDLTPSGVRRGFYDASASAARYYGNLQVVYVMESRLEEIRRNREDSDPNHPDNGTDTGSSAPVNPADQKQLQPDPQPEKKGIPNGGTGDGMSRKETPQGIDTRPHFMPVSKVLLPDGTTKSNDGIITPGNNGHFQTTTSTMSPAAGLEYDRTGGE